MVNQINAAELPKLFVPSTLMNISSAVQGLSVSKAKWQKIQFAAFGALAASSSVAASALLFSAAPVVIGIGVLGVIAATAYLIYAHQIWREKDKWLQAFSKIAFGNLQQGYHLLKQQLQPNAPKMLNSFEPVESCFKKTALTHYTPWEVRFAEAKDDSYLLKTHYASALLSCVLESVKKAPDATTRKKELAAHAFDIRFIKECFKQQRCGPSESQKAALAILEGDESVLAQHLLPIQIPKQYSIGHGILAEIASFLEMYDKKTLDKIKDASLIGKGSGCDNLNHWNTDLAIAKSWLKKDNLFGPVENKLITGLQNAKDMRAFCIALHSLSVEEIDLLAKRAVRV